MADIFQDFLEKHKDDPECEALYDSSYKNFHYEYKEYDNTYLALLGDCVIKLCYVEMLKDRENITEEKKKFESDEFFVNVIGRHYKILVYLKRYKYKDRPEDYEYVKKPGHNPRKYIATAVEAVIGAIYLEKNKDRTEITELLQTWMTFKEKKQ